MAKKKEDLVSKVIGNITSFLLDEIQEHGIFFFKGIIKRAVRKEALLIIFLISGIVFLGMGAAELLTIFLNRGISYLVLGIILIIIGVVQSY